MMIDIKDIIYWVLGILIAVVGWFMRGTMSRVEDTQKQHDKRINKLETEVAVIGKTVDNNFQSLSSSLDAMQVQISEIKALLIEQLKDNKGK